MRSWRSHSSSTGDDPEIASLIGGILGRQRANASCAISFDEQADVGAELYSGEAMLAIMRAYTMLRESSYLASVERAFDHEHAGTIGSVLALAPRRGGVGISDFRARCEIREQAPACSLRP